MNIKQLSDSPALDRFKWVRGLLMLLFWFILQIALLILGVLVLIHFFYFVFGSPPQWLQRSNTAFSLYIWQILRYLGFATDERPFPFSDWPDSEVVENNDS